MKNQTVHTYFGQQRRLMLALHALLLMMLILPTTTGSALLADSSSLSHDDTRDLGQRLAEWIRTDCGGHVDQRQVLRLDTSAAAAAEGQHEAPPQRGIFATEDIPADTQLLSVPWKCVIAPDSVNKEEAKLSDDEQVPMSETIDTTLNALKRSKQQDGQDDFMQPYLDILSSQRIALPFYDWSDAAKQTLDKITGHGLLPPYHLQSAELYQWLEQEKRQTTHDDKKDDAQVLATRAAISVRARAVQVSPGHVWIMAPWYDSYNHGPASRYYNTMRYGETKTGIEVWSTRDINAGEEIWNHYGTDNPALLLRDFGFCETRYPQQWTLEWSTAQEGDDDDDDGENRDDTNWYLSFTLDEESLEEDDDEDEDDDDNEEDAPQLYVSEWHDLDDGRRHHRIHAEHVIFLWRQLDRLRALKLLLLDEEDNHVVDNNKQHAAPEEWATIRAYHTTLTRAIATALDAALDELDEQQHEQEREPSKHQQQQQRPEEEEEDDDDDDDYYYYDYAEYE